MVSNKNNYFNKQNIAKELKKITTLKKIIIIIIFAIALLFIITISFLKIDSLYFFGYKPVVINNKDTINNYPLNSAVLVKKNDSGNISEGDIIAVKRFENGRETVILRKVISVKEYGIIVSEMPSSQGTTNVLFNSYLGNVQRDFGPFSFLISDINTVSGYLLWFIYPLTVCLLLILILNRKKENRCVMLEIPIDKLKDFSQNPVKNYMSNQDLNDGVTVREDEQRNYTGEAPLYLLPAKIADNIKAETELTVPQNTSREDEEMSEINGLIDKEFNSSIIVEYEINTLREQLIDEENETAADVNLTLDSILINCFKDNYKEDMAELLIDNLII